MRFTGSSLAQFNYRALVSLIDEAIPVFGFISAAGAPKDGKWGIFNVRGLLIVYPFFSPSKVVLFVSVFPEHYRISSETPFRAKRSESSAYQDFSLAPLLD